MNKSVYLIFISSLFIFLLSSTSLVSLDIDARERLKDSEISFSKIEPVKVETRGMNLRAVHFDLYLKVSNKSEGDVIIDKLKGIVLLGSKKSANFTHDNFTVIGPGQSSVQKLRVRVPIVGAITAVSKLPQEMTVTATANLTLKILKLEIETPFTYEISKTFRIPYNKIKKMVMEKAKKISF
jgi:hypothetical protein